MAQLTFSEWVEAVFNHSKTDFYAYLDYIDNVNSPTIDILPELELEYITQAFNDAQNTLAPFSDTQLGHALWYIASQSWIREVGNPEIEWSKRQNCIQSFYVLFSEIFDKRCEKKLNANCFEDCGNDLNLTCYMWWDIFPLWGDLEKRNPIDDAFLNVMKKTLTLDNVACHENALHGLGHLYRVSYARDIEKIIDDYLERNPTLPASLKAYAQSAEKGSVA